MSIKLRKKPAALVPTPDGVYVQLFVDEDGLPKLKDSDGNVVQLSESAILTLVEQGSDPASAANRIKLYGKDVAGNTELFAVDSDGNEVQITDDGSIAGGGPATQLATTTLPVTVSGATAPTTGQLLTATSSTNATWQDAPAGGLDQDPVIHHASFAAVANTSHYVWIGDGSSKTVTLPASPAVGDMIEITAVGSGSDEITIDGNGNDVTFGGFVFSFDMTFKGPGFRALLRWTEDDDNFWANLAGSVVGYFGNFGSPTPNAIIISELDGQANIHAVSDESVVGRTGGGPIGSIPISSLGGGPATELATTGTPVDVGSADPPTAGQVLTAVDADTAEWQDPAGGGPADELTTTGAPVDLTGAAPPTAGQVLTAIDATSAEWQTPSGGSSPVVKNQTTPSIVATAPTRQDIIGLNWTVTSTGIYVLEAGLSIARGPATTATLFVVPRVTLGTFDDRMGDLWFHDGTNFRHSQSSNTGSYAGAIVTNSATFYAVHYRIQLICTSLSGGSASFVLSFGGGTGSTGGTLLQCDDGYGVLTKIT